MHNLNNIDTSINIKKKQSTTLVCSLLFTVLVIFITTFCIRNILANEVCANSDDIAINFINLHKDRNILGKPFENNKCVEVIPCGLTVGVRINTDGIMVLGKGLIKTEDGDREVTEELKSGDLIVSANGKTLKNKEDLITAIEDNDDINLEVKRNDEICNVNIRPVKSLDYGTNKIGIWVRDSTQGVGTLTYYNPTTNKFGALGHAITDVDTKKILTVKEGQIRKAQDISIIKSQSGTPGEILGDIINGKKLGDIKLNNECGIYGSMDLDKLDNIPDKKMSIALKSEVHTGTAFIRSDIQNGKIETYDILIESVNNFDLDESKNMTIQIIDKRLLDSTNGIIQGMSGCPIIQDDKLVGAVTHVLVRNPSKGYGIFIENMIKQENFI
jgi:stage IV sporulation protein B